MLHATCVGRSDCIPCWRDRAPAGCGWPGTAGLTLLEPGHDLLGPNPGIALLHLDQQDTVNPVLFAGLQGAVRTAFAHVFLYATAISALTMAASFGLKEIPLRGS